MPIELKVDKFCDNCPEFKPDVDKETTVTIGYGLKNYTIITCVHRERCKSMYTHLYNFYEDEKWKEKQNEKMKEKQNEA